MTQEPNIFPYIARLLQGAEVVWKSLGEVVTTITAPTKLNRSEYKQEGSIPIIDQGIDFIAGYTDEAFTPVKSDTYILFGDHSEHIKYVDFAFIQGADGLKILKPKEGNTKYIYYAFINFYHKQLNYKRHWSVAKETIIPLPPLSVQQEIVRILDKFTQLEAELEAELDCRKRQYEYYRNKLLTFNEIGSSTEIVWKTLGEVAKKISSGGTPKTTVSEYYNGEIPWLRTQEVGYGEIWETSIKITEDAVKNSSAKWIPRDCVIIAMYGATVGKVGINKIPLTTNQACSNIEVNEDIANYKYVYYCLLNQYEYIKSLGAGSQTNINAQIVKKLKIPLPPLEEQNRIVTILDKFDTLVNSISEGLPKEIALRRKQYEYYREKLLTFPS
jgi:putative type I restriction-modification system specificity protein